MRNFMKWLSNSTRNLVVFITICVTVIVLFFIALNSALSSVDFPDQTNSQINVFEGDMQGKATAEVQEKSGTIYYVTVKSGSLNIRNEASKKGNVITKLYAGDTVLVISIADGWAKILMGDGTYAYASTNFLSLKKPITMSASKISDYKVNYIWNLEDDITATEVNGTKTATISAGYLAVFAVEDNQAIFAKGRELYYFDIPEPQNFYTVSDSILCAYSTFFNQSNFNRTNNILLGANAMQKVLQPNEVYSFNTVVGERTREKGYLEANAYSNYQVVKQVGGGVCQLSSTLFATIRQDMYFTNVHAIAHNPEVTYLPIGMDATVNYGSRDFYFTNSHNFPVQILAFVSNERLTIVVQKVQ